MAEVERVKPRAMYVEEAIQFALESRWSEALAVNRALLERHGEDEETFNRLGKALSELGQAEEALDAYQKSLRINPLNIIAQKNVRKLSALLQAPTRPEGMAAAIDVDLFTEEPGKSGITVLVPPAGGVDVAVAPGDVVELHVDRGQLRARTVRGIDLGDVDTKLARRLVPLMISGNRYSAAVARVDDRRIEVMIRETYQAPENARKTSFAIARGARREEFRPYAKESLLASRGIDDEAAEEEENLPGSDDNTEELEGLQPVEAETDESGGFEMEDDADEDVRPEDEY
ncbi:MAG: repeat-containing protein [Chloroflexi bacterium]|nr:repeat-containing protein [Chloroflexota bacterium]